MAKLERDGQASCQVGAPDLRRLGRCRKDLSLLGEERLEMDLRRPGLHRLSQMAAPGLFRCHRRRVLGSNHSRRVHKWTRLEHFKGRAAARPSSAK